MIVGYEISETLIDHSLVLTGHVMRAIAPTDPFYETWPRTEDGIAYTWDLTSDGSLDIWINPPNLLMRLLGDTIERRLECSRDTLQSRLKKKCAQGRRLYQQLYPGIPGVA